MEPGETSPTISSFVIRFVHAEGAAPEQPPASLPTPPYRGTIRHVQTDQEQAFTRWEDAVAFIQRFVPLLVLEQASPEDNS
jgi:hypothetical protein